MRQYKKRMLSTACFSDRRGFTLIEMLVVVAIITALSSVSLMMVMQQLPNMRLRSGLGSIRGQLNTAKSQSIRVGLPVLVVVNPGARSMSFFIDNNNNCIPGDTANVTTYDPDLNPIVTSVSDTFLRRYTLPPSIEFGFGPPYPDPPSSGPSSAVTSFSTSDYVYFNSTTNSHQTGDDYVLVFNTNGRFQDLNKKYSYAVIYICNPYGKYAAIEILAGGTAIGHLYNPTGDNTWRNS